MTDDDEREYHDKNIAYYQTVVQAWFATRLEQDKVSIALSSGGIGLLAALLTAGLQISAFQAGLVVGALVAFAVSIGVGWQTFGKNTEYIESVISDKEPKSLAWRDRVAQGAFATGGVLVVVLTITLVPSALSRDKEIGMADAKKTEKVPLRESFDGARRVKPAEPDSIRSFQGSEGLAPRKPAQGGKPAAGDSTATGTKPNKQEAGES